VLCRAVHVLWALCILRDIDWVISTKVDFEAA
jgi:hypothetical protein